MHTYFYIFTILLIFTILIYIFSERKPYRFIGLAPLEQQFMELDSKKVVNDATVSPVASTTTTPIDQSPAYCHVIEPSKIWELLPTFGDLLYQCEQLNASFKAQNKKTISSGQFICHKTLEAIFGRPFIANLRADFLKSTKTKCNLELDGFNQDLMLAFEYNGYQHYNYPNRYHKNYKEFTNQIENDRYKKRMCPYLGITLLIIPYTISDEDIPLYIANLLPPEYNQYRLDL